MHQEMHKDIHMGLLDDMKSVQAEGRNRPAGIIEKWVASLPEADRADFGVAIQSDDIDTRTIWKVLRAKGLDVSEATVSRYRSTVRNG